MRELIETIDQWLAQGQQIAVATVVKTAGSSPRPLGSKMVINDSGAMAGSVSGGCVEGAVFEEAQSVLESGQSKRVSYGITDEQAWEVGLSCGGELEVLIEKLT